MAVFIKISLQSVNLAGHFYLENVGHKYPACGIKKRSVNPFAGERKAVCPIWGFAANIVFCLIRTGNHDAKPYPYPH
ncbi:MAG: hypothetical protein Q3966_09655, partial [Neisseria sp.]|nr:hypothetical protein [Neisseria sp.]